MRSATGARRTASSTNSVPGPEKRYCPHSSRRRGNRPMTEPLIFEGLTYIPIKDASAGSHLSTEYLARLARAGRIARASWPTFGSSKCTPSSNSSPTAKLGRTHHRRRMGNGTLNFGIAGIMQAESGTVALHPDLSRTAAAECYAAAQNADDTAIKQAYLELMQGWRVLADEADRLKSRASARYEFLIAGRGRVPASAPRESILSQICPREPGALLRNSRKQCLRARPGAFGHG